MNLDLINNTQITFSSIITEIIYKNLYILKVNPIEKSGIAKEQIPVIATIIINIGLTKFALTAASPQY